MNYFLKLVQYTHGNLSYSNINSKRFQDVLQTTSTMDEQQKIKVAFTEGENLIFKRLFCFLFLYYLDKYSLGYVAGSGEPKSKERPSLLKAVRIILLYGILFIILLNITSALGGGMKYKDYLFYFN